MKKSQVHVARGECMVNLRAAVSMLQNLPYEAVLFAEKVDGQFTPESRVEVLELSDAELHEPTSEVANGRAPGTEYFLEVSVAQDVIAGWRSNLEADPGLDEVVERLIRYAENDA